VEKDVCTGKRGRKNGLPMPSTGSKKSFEMKTNLSILLGAVVLSLVATELFLQWRGWFGTPG